MNKALVVRAAFVLGLAAQFARAQDAAQQILMQNQVQEQLQVAQQVNDITLKAMQQSADQTALLSQNAFTSVSPGLPSPQISVKSGQYAGPIQVSIKDRVQNAQIFYTTDGWTPTPASQQYTGPITIRNSITLKAAAFLPNCGRSVAVAAEYTLPSELTAPSTQADTVRVKFTSPVNSRNARVGDAAPLALAEDLHWEGRIIPAETPVLAVVTQVSRPYWSGIPGSISFSVRSISLPGTVIPLSGYATKDGTERASGRGWPLSRGMEAEIPKGAGLTVKIAAS